MSQVARFFNVAAVASLLVGCVTRIPAAPDRLQSDGPPPMAPAWPPRRTHDLQAIADAMPREIEWLRFSRDGSYAELRPLFRIHDAWPAGQGLFRLIEQYDADGTLPDESEPMLEFISFPPSDTPPAALMTPLHVRWYPQVSHTVEIAQPRSAPPRGLIIWIPGLGLDPFADHLKDCLQRENWAILTVRFTSPDAAMTFVVDTDSEAAEETGRSIAERVDESGDSAPYAVEAALGLIQQDHPSWLDGPVVAVGISAGAIGLPIMVGRHIGDLDAAVLIAGGVNLLRIGHEGVFDAGMLRVRFTDGGDNSDRQRLYDAYLQHVTLDPYHAAPLLRRVPVLQIDGRFDRVVPAETGDLLYERLGRPERWRYFGGHGFVLFSLLFESDRIVDWIEAHTLGEDR
jgi:hypothetical protein